MADKYVAYVSCYTHGNKDGIKIYDVDMKNGIFKEKSSIQVSNSSYITISHNEKHLYSITDFGVEAYDIQPDGMLTVSSAASINGMRGCYLSTDYEDKFLFVAGYHDGKITVLSINEDGSLGPIVDEVYHKGIGTIADRNFRPHVTCVKMTRDNKYLLAADLGVDHVKVYELDHVTGKLRMVDIIHSEQYSGPRHLKISKDGQYVYIIHEAKCYVDVYKYTEKSPGVPEFETLQNVLTLNESHAGDSAASGIDISDDYKYITCSNAGDNSVSMFEINQKTGKLDKVFCLPISGSYPKDATLFPDNRHLVSLNHESNTMTFFKVNVKDKTLVMNTKALNISLPNCIIFYKCCK